MYNELYECQLEVGHIGHSTSSSDYFKDLHISRNEPGTR